VIGVTSASLASSDAGLTDARLLPRAGLSPPAAAGSAEFASRHYRAAGPPSRAGSRVPAHDRHRRPSPGRPHDSAYRRSNGAATYYKIAWVTVALRDLDLTCDMIGDPEGVRPADLRDLLAGWADLRTTEVEMVGSLSV
jgi:hypothetical protein